MIILYCLICEHQPNNTDNAADGTENKPFHAHSLLQQYDGQTTNNEIDSF
jgi:hypothetical protein